MLALKVQCGEMGPLVDFALKMLSDSTSSGWLRMNGGENLDVVLCQ